MKTLKVFIVTIMITFLAVSCQKESSIIPSSNPETSERGNFGKNETCLDLFDSNDMSVEIVQLDSDRQLTFKTSQWGGHRFLRSTGNSADYFTPGTYAVQIKRNWLSPSTLNISAIAQNQGLDYNAYTWAYKFDEDGTQLYYSGSKTFNMGEPAYFDLSITGDQSIVFVLNIVRADDYIYWYRRAD